MSWSPDMFIGKKRPWPDEVHVVKGNYEVIRRYVPEDRRTCRPRITPVDDNDSQHVAYVCFNRGNRNLIVTKNAHLFLRCPICGRQIERSE